MPADSQHANPLGGLIQASAFFVLGLALAFFLDGSVYSGIAGGGFLATLFFGFKIIREESYPLHKLLPLGTFGLLVVVALIPIVFASNDTSMLGPVHFLGTHTGLFALWVSTILLLLSFTVFLGIWQFASGKRAATDAVATESNEATSS